MRLATADQALQIDRIAQAEYGLSGEALMESAGSLAAREITLNFLPELTGSPVAVVVGPGNNGGDALVVARHLHAAGVRDLEVLLIAPPGSQSSLFQLQRQRCERQGVSFIDLLSRPERSADLSRAGLIVDGVFGVGLCRPVGEPYLAVLKAMNAARAPKVSLDAPSGLNSTTGQVESLAVQASLTISFGLAKPGFFVSEGPAHVGRLRVLPIGFPSPAVRALARTHFLFTERQAKRFLPRRRNASNKSNHGHLLLLAGRPGFWGAGVLAAHSAYRMGAGYVTWASFEAPVEALREIPEALTARANDEEIWSAKISAVAIGPGLGAGRDTAALIERLKSDFKGPVVLDADAITACVEHKLFPLPASWVLTPHAGELARVLKISAADIEKDRFQTSGEAHRRTGCHVLLKGFRTVIASPGRWTVIHSGNSALAKAGTGDVLTGMVGGLLAQGLETLPAAATAAYLHGRLADEWVREGRDKSSLLASDLKDLLPPLVMRLRQGGL